MSTDIRRKAITFDIKAVDDSTGSFEVYANVFGNVDRADEVVAPGAFVNLPEFVKDGWGDVNHSWKDLGITLIDEATQDAKGLRVKGRFHSTPDAQSIRTKVRERMEAGKSVKCSIGYRVLSAAGEVRDGRPITVLKQIELYEFSFVNLPANPLAEVVGAKGEVRLSDVNRLIDGVKAGRTLSKQNHKQLSELHDHMSSGCSRLKTFLDQYGPDSPAAESDSSGEVPAVDDDGKARKVQVDELRARSLRLRSLCLPD